MKVYLIGDDVDLDERERLAETFEGIKHKVAFSCDSANLRAQIVLLLSSNAICLLDGWWTSRDALALQTIAAWLKMKVFDTDGKRVTTLSLKG